MADQMIAPEEILIWGLDPFPEGEDHSDLADPERLELPVSEELIESIDKAGVIRPIMVRAVKASIWRTFRKSKNDRAYIAIDGRQCLRAARELNRRRKDSFPVLVPYVIRELAEGMAALAPGIANSGAQKDTPLMSAQRIVRLQNRGYSLEDMRCSFDGNPSVQTLKNYLALLKVVPELRAKLGGEISWTDGYTLGKLKPAEQLAAVAANKPGTIEYAPAPAILDGPAAQFVAPKAAPTPRLPSQRTAARPSLGRLKSICAALEPGEADEVDPEMDLAAEVLRFVVTGSGDFSRWPSVGRAFK